MGPCRRSPFRRHSTNSLMARLDRLAPVKEIGQIGAAIGREFSYSLLRALVGRDETALKDALAQLEDAELVFRRGDPPEAIYSFKHALVQEVAYENLLKSRRQVLHRRIAEILRDRFQTMAETSRRSSPIISRRRGSAKLPSNGGSRRVTERWTDPPTTRRSRISKRRSAWPRDWPMVLPSNSSGCGCRPRTVMHYFMVEGTASRRRLLRLRALASLPRGSKTSPRGSRPITACGW